MTLRVKSSQVNELHVATTFPRVTLVAGIGPGNSATLDHKRTELPTIPIGALEQTTFQHHGEKKSCVRSWPSGTEWPWRADEREKPVANKFYKVRQGQPAPSLRRLQNRAGQDDAPPRRHEAIIAASAGRRPHWFSQAPINLVSVTPGKSVIPPDAANDDSCTCNEVRFVSFEARRPLQFIEERLNRRSFFRELRSAISVERGEKCKHPTGVAPGRKGGRTCRTQKRTPCKAMGL